MSDGRLSSSPFQRVVAWLVLGATFQVLLLPALTPVSAAGSAAYGEWLADRGAVGSHPELERALEQAAGERHASLEGFVRQFVTNLEEAGGLAEAFRAFRADGTSAEQLLALILRDLRSLSPREPLSDARVRSAEQVALSGSARDVSLSQGHIVPEPLRHSAAVPIPVLRADEHGLLSSIQALGP